MKTFITIFLKEKENTNIGMLTDFVKNFVGFSAQVINGNHLSFVFEEIEDVSFNELTLAINYDLLINAKVFKGPTFDNQELLNEYLDMVDKLDAVNMKDDIIYESNLIVSHLGNKELIKKRVFGRYYSTRLEEEIKTYLDNNMNISKASDTLYLHRNTLMNKIDKFVESSGYDIKKFKDAFVIYHLLIN